MGQPTRSQRRYPTLPANWPIQLALTTLAFAAYMVIVYTSVIHPYWLRVAAAVVCVGLWSFVGGFRPFTADKKYGNLSEWTPVVTSLGLFVVTTTELSGLNKLSPDERYPAMLKPAFMIPFLLFNAVNIASYLAGVKLFRQMFPERALVPYSEEDE